MSDKAKVGRSENTAVAEIENATTENAENTAQATAEKSVKAFDKVHRFPSLTVADTDSSKVFSMASVTIRQYAKLSSTQSLIEISADRPNSANKKLLFIYHHDSEQIEPLSTKRIFIGQEIGQEWINQYGKKGMSAVKSATRMIGHSEELRTYLESIDNAENMGSDENIKQRFGKVMGNFKMIIKSYIAGTYGDINPPKVAKAKATKNMGAVIVDNPLW